MTIIKNIILFVFLLLCSIAFAQNNSCSLASSATPVEILNWQDKFDNSVTSDFIASLSYGYGDSLILVRGYKNSTEAAYLVPLKKIKNSLIADLNLGVKIPANTVDAIFRFDNNGIYAITGYSNDKKELVYLSKDGRRTTVGTIVAADVYLGPVTQIIYLDLNNNLFMQKNTDTAPTPLINQKLLDLSKINRTSGLIEGNEVIFMRDTTRAEVLNLSTNQTTTEAIEIDSSDFIFKRSKTNKVHSFAGNINQKSHWLQEVNSNDFKFFAKLNDKKIPLNIKSLSLGSNSEHNMYAGADGHPKANFMLIRNYPSKQYFILDAKKVSCSDTYLIKPEANFRFSEKLKNTPVCNGADSSPQAWDKSIGLDYSATIRKKELTYSEIDYLLQRMLKEDRLTRLDIQLIEQIATSNHYTEFSEILSLLINKFSSLNPMKSLLLIDLSKIKKLKLSGEFKQICVNSQSFKEMSSFYKQSLLEKAKKLATSNQALFNIQHLLFLRDYVTILTNEDKEDLAGQLGTLLAESIQRNDFELRNMFFSTLDWVSTQKVKDLLGLKKINLTDLVLIEDSFTAKAYIVGTDEILNDGQFNNNQLRRTFGGFFSLGPYYLQTRADEYTSAISWLHGQDRYEADIISKKRKTDFVMPIVDKPNKEELLDDKIYHGLVVFGSNFNGQSLIDSKESYLEYLEQNGFASQSPVEITNSLAWLEDRISGKSEKIDFMIKEAHSDGDYRNLFSLNKKMYLIRSTLQHPEYQEIIDILYHDNTYNPDFISNKIFSDWLKTRKQNKGGQFIYLNTSCNSTTKVAAELGIAESTDLVIVASLTSVYAFNNHQGNSTYYLFDGIRKMFDFRKIAELTKDTKGKYIFPHQPEYKTSVIDMINKGYEIKTVVYKLDDNGNRKPYHIEQELNSHRQ